VKRVLTTLVAITATATVIGARAGADRAATEKQLIANERAINGAFAKGDVKTFYSMIDRTGVGIDNMGVTKIADLEQIIPTAKIANWTIDDMHVVWVNADTAILYYKWSGGGTVMGQPVPSPVYSSSVWTKRAGK
jgi:hypothetical protein